MTIREYLYLHRVSLTELARRVGKPVPTVHGWKSGRTRPEWACIPAIEAATGGLVRAEDFVPREGAPK